MRDKPYIPVESNFNKEKSSDVRKIVFHHGRALGDVLMMTAGVRDFKLLFPEILINVDTKYPAFWENNPYIDRSLDKNDPGVEYYEVGYPVIGNINNSNVHFTQAFLFDMIAIADFHKRLPMSIGEFCAAYANGSVGDPSLGNPNKNPKAKEPFISLRDRYSKFCQVFSRQRGDIHLSEFEKKNSLVKEMYGYDKYWLIAPGGKRDCTTKIWDWRRFQEVINYYKGKIKFVVIGRSDHLIEKLNYVIDLTDKFNKDIRGMIPLVYHAEGCVSGVSFLMHLAAAMPPRWKKERKPCVAIYGGREPTGFTSYTNHQILHTNGAFDCCDNGGCWKSRTHPLPKSPDLNKRLCSYPVQDRGRTIQSCMNSITVDDVIRAIGKYYDGNIYTFLKNEEVKLKKREEKVLYVHDESEDGRREINLLGSLSTKGGGEQSLCMIAKVLQEADWKVNLYPFGKVHENYENNGIDIKRFSFDNGMAERMKPGLPLLFYGNDSTTKFVESAQEIVEKSSKVIVGINYINRPIPKCRWLAQSGKLKAVIFQNNEKKDEFARDQVGFDNTELITLFGAVNLNAFLEVCPPIREKKEDELVVLKHCTADWRKYVTIESEKRGEKIHIWQKNIIKENDVKFYSRLLKDVRNVKFEFMEAHKELVRAFIDEPRMVFHKWDSMPVTEFLSRGHVYLYRTSNCWRDQYPRVLAEALAAGLPALTEPRDGTKDRIRHGDTGFLCIDFDGFLYALKLLRRKEGYRQHMGRNAKDWARINLRPEKWVEVIERLV